MREGKSFLHTLKKYISKKYIFFYYEKTFKAIIIKKTL